MPLSLLPLLPAWTRPYIVFCCCSLIAFPDSPPSGEGCSELDRQATRV